jgi:hypothetical protein
MSSPMTRFMSSTMSVTPVIQVERLTFHNLVTREGQQLSGEGSGFVAGFPDLCHAALRPGGLSRFIRQELSPAINNRQKIVEVVCNSSGHASQGFHFLRLAKLAFEILSVKELRDHGSQLGSPFQSR